jgi:uncharacterized protein YndB with AHSA1/START domain
MLNNGDADREIVSARSFDAARADVFSAFSDPERLKQWWGPNGFSSEFQEFELKPGGLWRLSMRGPDGAEYRMTKQFVEVVAPERIVLRHEQAMHSFTMSMLFDESGGRTLLTWRMLFDFEAEAKAVRSFIEVANEENFDRLLAHLRASASKAS